MYGDYNNKLITLDEFVEILNIIKNYVFRRSICGIPTNILNKIFASLYKNIKYEAYVQSLKATFLLMTGNRRFPSDKEFTRELKLKNVYNFIQKNYLLESLENFERKELVHAVNYTIEHIIPQNPKTPIEWQKELGENWKLVKENYLHTLGNLSLTAYNSELSDKSFIDKKTIKGGFNNSPLFLNESVKIANVWNEEAINNRADKLAQRALKVWQFPHLDDDVLDLYKNSKTTKNAIEYSINHYKHLENGLLDLYRQFEKRVLNIDATVIVEFKKLYIAFKSQTNFVDVTPEKSRLKLYLNINFKDIKDPNNLCIDATGIGKWGKGNVKVHLNNTSELDYIIELVKQAFAKQIHQ